MLCYKTVDVHQSKDFSELWTCLQITLHIVQPANNTKTQLYNKIFSPFVHKRTVKSLVNVTLYFERDFNLLILTP